MENKDDSQTTVVEYQCVSKTDTSDIKSLNADGTCPSGYDKKEKK